MNDWIIRTNRFQLDRQKKTDLLKDVYLRFRFKKKSNISIFFIRQKKTPISSCLEDLLVGPIH